MGTAYLVSLVVAGVVLFLLLMRLVCSSWEEVGECFIYLFKPQWLSALTGDFNEDNWKSLKLILVALVSAFIMFEVHRRAGTAIWASLIGT